jgi:hypothetical protein
MKGPELPGLQERKTNHAKLWLVALLVSGLVAGVAYAFFAEFEHESWFSRELRSFLNRNELEVFVGGALGLAVLLALVFYRAGWFSREAQQESGWARPGTAGPEGARKPIGPAGRKTQKPSGHAPMEVLLQRDRRACHGDLVLTDQRLFFICRRDESITRAVGGQAVASQFGILGVLLHALFTKKGRKRKLQELESARRESEGLSLEAQAAKSPYSLNLTPQEISRVTKNWTGTHIQVGTNKYKFLKIEPGQIAVLGNWCREHGVAAEGL